MRLPCLMSKSLHFEWYMFLHTYRRRSPLLMAYMRQGPQAGRLFDYSALLRKVERVEGWIAEAKSAFLDSDASFFWKCNIINRTKRQKHWRHRTMGPLESLYGDFAGKERVQFHPVITEESMQEGLWTLFAVYFDEFKWRRVEKATIDFEKTVGFSKGQETSLVQYEIWAILPKPSVLLFPVIASEVQNYPFVRLSAYHLGFTPPGSAQV